MFFKHFVGKIQLPGLSVSGTLVENRLNSWRKMNGGIVRVNDEQKKKKTCRNYYMTITITGILNFAYMNIKMILSLVFS